MKSSDRLVYLVLSTCDLPRRFTEEQDGPLCLCAFCTYAAWSGSCSETEMECEHPLAERVREFEEAAAWEPGVDCWGFRPRWRLAEIADYVGQRLEGHDVSLRHSSGNQL